jgi:voltage-gated sodium channel
MTAGFERAVTAVILANSVLLVWGLISHDELADHLETGCLVFFVGELVVRLRRAGWNPARFLRQPWAVFDVVVIALSLAPLLGADTSLLRLAKLSRMAHWLRHVTGLRAVRLVARLAR